MELNPEKIAFLKAIEKCAPEVIDDLMVIFDRFQKDPTIAKWTPKWLNDPERADLRKEVENWAQKYWLTYEQEGRRRCVPWILEVAVNTLSHWSIERSRQFVPPSPSRNAAELPGNQYTISSYFPVSQTRKAHYDRETRQFRQYLRQYEDAAEQLAQATREKREAQHVQWLVLRQVCGWRLAKIAQVGSISTVSEPTAALARQLGLSLRRQPAGRPRSVTRPCP